MNKPKLTSGEWEIVFNNYPEEPRKIILGIGSKQETPAGNYYVMICNSILPDTDKEYIEQREQIESDMKMIAASKDLAEALNEIVENYPFGVNTILVGKAKETMDKAKAALLKAGYTE